MADGFNKENCDGNFSNFSKKTKHSDVQFIVENEEVYASKAVLCISSPVFDEMFEKDPTEAVELPGVKLEHFKQFLKCIYPDRLDEINEETVYWVLPFAHKYKVKNLRERCIKMVLEIIKSRYEQNAKELYRHIKLSELYELHEIEDLCIDMASECTVTEKEEANKNYPISPCTDLRIIKIGHRKLEMVKEDAEWCSEFLSKDNLKSAIVKLLGPKYYLKSTDKRLEDHYYRSEYFKEEEKAKNYMQALRLIHKHLKNNQELRQNAMGKLSSLEQLTDEDLKLSELLPHDLKMQFEKYKQSQ